MSRRARLKTWLRRVGRAARSRLESTTGINGRRRPSSIAQDAVMTAVPDIHIPDPEPDFRDHVGMEVVDDCNIVEQLTEQELLSQRGYPENSDLNWALGRACDLGHEDVVRALLGVHGVSPSSPSSFKKQDLPEVSTPLHIAVQAQHVDIVKFLAGNGADPNARDELGKTPLHYAAGRDVINILLKQGAALDVRDKSGDTPLDAAMRSGRHRAVMELLAQGATPTVPIKKPKPISTVTETRKSTPAEIERTKLPLYGPRLDYTLFWRR